MKTKKINWIFFGSDQFSIDSLKPIIESGLTPNLIVSVPDSKQGRKLENKPSTLKKWSENKNIEVISPEKLRGLSLPEIDWDFFLVSSYGKIIPEEILNIPKKGVLNIHPSLLPFYRGPSPIQSAILDGPKETGVSIMLLDKEMDHGPIIIQEKTTVADKNYEELSTELAKMGGNLIVKILPDWLEGEIKATEQDHTSASYTQKITKEQGEIKLDDNPILNDRKIRAFLKQPGIYFYIEKNNKKIRIKVTEAELLNQELIIKKVIPEGKKEMNWQDYARNL